MELTKKQAIEEHRKMWNWIAEQYDTKRVEEICDLKKEYIDNIKPEYKGISHNCFCCGYGCLIVGYKDKCLQCPVVWPVERNERTYCEDKDNPYGEIREVTYRAYYSNDINFRRAAELARKIANLPVRK